MKESNLKIAQKDIDDALKTVEDIVSVLDNTDLPKNVLKEKFVTLTEKVQELENILKTEGIL
ncbi:hypothetical protein PMY56_08565 [Clostridium tertium]|jgi:hypothetical protein|uniref:Uncharacterized protein n=1 Tax=Clostridium tertium TaxID=1559 RepID=A0A9X3XI01_9CLOT|nr:MULTISPECIES: hypothetical protein [Clostridium]EEH99399.1 hypothetical protein CSBG_03025 [Clostridium sp. 7_2_43FAA]MBP1868005.1 peptidoglycan hydrolase CwlO-like protein [Clostridium tertium]MBS5307150.1 hypothetical protein [Clostridium sp.]MBU6136407.1 hypothetical protein [Clostridium tertium]MDB1923038.1 hypothetical protein [Clostridium tertium]